MTRTGAVSRLYLELLYTMQRASLFLAATAGVKTHHPSMMRRSETDQNPQHNPWFFGANTGALLDRLLRKIQRFNRRLDLSDESSHEIPRIYLGPRKSPTNGKRNGGAANFRALSKPFRLQQYELRLSRFCKVDAISNFQPHTVWESGGRELGSMEQQGPPK
ncbi:uncharacterized protein BJX67DRAFT_306798 [Aspergillus lucknowensis]|uniref:Uncharacterized protein n=1 Tax=Aspergillus lucknowensis TaxID=176173 RepID=A0ABR4M000_9EURO